MKVAVCDGCCADMESLVLMLKRCGSEEAERVRITGYFCFEDILVDAASAQYDAVFLAAGGEMPEPKAAQEKLAKAGFCGRIILTCGALPKDPACADVISGYLQKPFKLREVRALIKSFKEPACASLLLKASSGALNIMPDKIAFAESGRNCCIVHTVSGRAVTVRLTLSQLGELLGGGFLRCHRSFIVNMEQIAYAGDDFFLFGGERVLIRRRDRRSVIAEYERFLSGRSS